MIALDHCARDIGNMIVATDLYTRPGAYDELFMQLRLRQPVARAEPDGFEPFWVVTKHADILNVERQSELFVNAPRSVLRSEAVTERVKKATGGSPFLLRNLTNLDGNDHSSHRRLTQDWFMPARVKKLEREIRAFAISYVDRMLALGEECDFVRDVAVWYPLHVIMSILGVPPEDEPKMLQLTQQIFGPDDPDIKQGFKGDIVETVHEFFEYFEDIARRRVAEPGDDLGTVIARATIGGCPIGDLEKLSYFILTATAGHDTTSSTTAGGLLALVQNPDQFRKLQADPTLMQTAVNEMIRWVTPVTHFFRTATAKYDLGGQRIAAGDSLMMCYRSANRDEDVFVDPFSFDVARHPNPHVAFGYGPHVCLGQHLAKLEVAIFFEELLRRIEDVELAGDPQWVASNFVGGLKSLPIQFRSKS